MNVLEHSTRLLFLLEQFSPDDDCLLEELIAHALERLRLLTSWLFRRRSDLRGLEQTDDVLQEAVIRLHHALRSTRPTTVRGFFGLAAMQIRWTLGDLARKHSKLRLVHSLAGDEDACLPDGDRPVDLLEWAEFHQSVGNLPAEEREAVELLWYQGLTQEEAARVCGISLRTMKRRWLAARLHLARAVDPPGG